MQLPTPGTVFEGKYKILQALGKGGFATVFRATDLQVHRDVAIKILAPRDGEYQPGIVARFSREATVIAALQDPHTIRLFEFGESSDGLLYMVFQYVAGVDLATLLQRRGSLPPEIVEHVTTQVLHALAEAHAAGVLHRDIKPANVLIHEYMGDEFSAKLLDFGIAKVDSSQTDGASLTKTGTMLGTPRYMSPEQIFGESLGPASDIYGLGLVAFEMLVGRPAVDGTREEMLRRQVSSEAFFVPTHIAWPTLRQVIERMLAKEPHARYQSTREVIAAWEFAMQNREGMSSGPFPTDTQHPRDPTWSAEHSGAVSGSRPITHTGSTESPPTGSGRLVLAGAVALAAAVALLGYAVTRRPQRTAPRGDAALPGALLKAAPEPPAAATDDAGTSADAGTVEDTRARGTRARRAGKVKSGCGRDQAWNAELWVDAAGRTARVYLPEAYDKNRPYPLIVGFGPRNWDIHHWVSRSGLSAIAYSANEVILVGVPPADRMDPWLSHGDLDVIRAAINDTAAEYCVDPGRIFAIGFGEGGAMARRVACDIPLAGLATISDAERAREPSCQPQPPVPHLHLLGRLDPFYPPEGGSGCLGGDYMSLQEHDLLWRRRNVCSEESTPFFDDGTSRCVVYACEAAPYASCRFEGGHYLRETRWSMLDPPACSAPILAVPPADVVWRFLREHGREIED